MTVPPISELGIKFWEVSLRVVGLFDPVEVPIMELELAKFVRLPDCKNEPNPPVKESAPAITIIISRIKIDFTFISLVNF